MPSENNLGLVQGLGLAPLGDVLVWGLDLGEGAVQVQVPVVVRGQDHAGVPDCLLHLSQPLRSRAGIRPQEMLSNHLLGSPGPPCRQPRGSSGAVQGTFSLFLCFPSIPEAPRELRPQTYSHIEDLEEFTLPLQGMYFDPEVHLDLRYCEHPERKEAAAPVGWKSFTCTVRMPEGKRHHSGYSKSI